MLLAAGEVACAMGKKGERKRQIESTRRGWRFLWWANFARHRLRRRAKQTPLQSVDYQIDGCTFVKRYGTAGWCWCWPAVSTLLCVAGNALTVNLTKRQTFFFLFPTLSVHYRLSVYSRCQKTRKAGDPFNKSPFVVQYTVSRPISWSTPSPILGWPINWSCVTTALNENIWDGYRGEKMDVTW